MRDGRRGWFVVGILAVSSLLVPTVVRAQPTGLNRPWIPPRGEWLQVLTATDRWLVLQNPQGQQFPVAYDVVGSFVVRWPSSVDRIVPQDLVEVTGVDLGSNQLGTDQIDIYKGSSRNLVTPTLQQLYGFNRVMTPFDMERQRVLGINYQFLLSPQELLMPVRLHVVASAANLQPLQLMSGGNNVLTVAPGPSGASVTEVTQGSPRFVQPGDMAYVVPLLERSGPRSVVLGQLVIYKTVGVDQFAR